MRGRGRIEFKVLATETTLKEAKMVSQEEKKVWSTLLELNECWSKSDGAELVNYFHRDMVAITPTDRERLVGRDDCVAGWMRFSKAAKIHYWKEIDPKITLFSDTAIVTYYYGMSFDMAGRTIKSDGRDMFVFVKENNKWWAVANQFSPYPGQTD